MTLFELEFGLGAVILGLALTHLASSLSRLVLAGRRVHWAPEPLLLAALITLVIVSVWLGPWVRRQETSALVGLILLRVIKLLAPYMAATYVLPEHAPETGEVDLLERYYRTRGYAYAALIGGLLLFWIDAVIEPIFQHRDIPWSSGAGVWAYIALYTVLIIFRARWLHIVGLTAALLAYAWQVLPSVVTQ